MCNNLRGELTIRYWKLELTPMSDKGSIPLTLNIQNQADKSCEQRKISIR